MLCHARFEIIAVVLMKTKVFWDTTLCGLVKIVTNVSQKFLLMSLDCRQSRLLSGILFLSKTQHMASIVI
jgi:hypothetical protein